MFLNSLVVVVVMGLLISFPPAEAPGFLDLFGKSLRDFLGLAVFTCGMVLKISRQ